MRRRTRATLALAAMLTTGAAALAAAGPASATYKPQPFHLVCGSGTNGGTLQGSVCALPAGVTTPATSYSATITSVAGGTTSFAVASGSLPPGLALPGKSTSGIVVITGTPARAGVYHFTINATDVAGKTVSLAYEITITTAGAPDQLVCAAGSNGGFLESGTCVLPDATVGQAYAGHLFTSHQAGGTLGVVAGTLPPGLSLPATFTGSGDTIGGTPAQPGTESTYTFTAAGSGDQGQPLYQVFSITVDPNQPLTVVLPASGSTLFPGTVGQAFAINFFLSGGAAPFTWAVTSGKLPPGLSLQTFSDPRDANDELAGTPTTAGTFTWTMRVTDLGGQQATQQFTLTIQS
jgi:hypothetical protein